MKNYLFIVPLILSLFSCDSSTISENSTTATPDKSEIVETINNIEPEIRLTDKKLTIIDSELSYDPFNYKRNPVELLQSNPIARTEFETYENRHVDNVIDTMFSIYIDSNKFKIYKSSNNQILYYSEVYSKHFITKQKLRVGLTKDEFMSKLKNYNIEIIPDSVCFQSVEITESVDFIFKSDTVSKIIINGYVD